MHLRHRIMKGLSPKFSAISFLKSLLASDGLRWWQSGKPSKAKSTGQTINRARMHVIKLFLFFVIIIWLPSNIPTPSLAICYNSKYFLSVYSDDFYPFPNSNPFNLEFALLSSASCLSKLWRLLACPERLAWWHPAPKASGSQLSGAVRCFLSSRASHSEGSFGASWLAISYRRLCECRARLRMMSMMRMSRMT